MVKRVETRDLRIRGARIRTMRKAAGLTQKELAEKAGISVRTVQSMERTGSGYISVDAYCRVAWVFGITVDELTHVDYSPENEEAKG